MTENMTIGVTIGENCSIDPTVKFVVDPSSNDRPIVIERDVIIRSGAILYEGVVVRHSTTIDHYAIIRNGTELGCNNRIMNFSEIGRDVKIGSHSRIGGFVCNRSQIGDQSVCLGDLVHRYELSEVPSEEASPTIGSNVLVARGATIVGATTICDGEIVKIGEIRK